MWCLYRAGAGVVWDRERRGDWEMARINVIYSGSGRVRACALTGGLGSRNAGGHSVLRRGRAREWRLARDERLGHWWRDGSFGGAGRPLCSNVIEVSADRGDASEEVVQLRHRGPALVVVPDDSSHCSHVLVRKIIWKFHPGTRPCLAVDDNRSRRMGHVGWDEHGLRDLECDVNKRELSNEARSDFCDGVLLEQDLELHGVIPWFADQAAYVEPILRVRPVWTLRQVPTGGSAQIGTIASVMHRQRHGRREGHDRRDGRGYGYCRSVFIYGWVLVCFRQSQGMRVMVYSVLQGWAKQGLVRG